MKDATEIVISVRSLKTCLQADRDWATANQLESQLGERIDLQSQKIGYRQQLVLKLLIEGGEITEELIQDVREALHEYFTHAENIMRTQRMVTLRRGWQSAKVGVLFLMVLLFLSEGISYLEGRVADIFSDGLAVLAWVALWRPTEELVYDWHPFTSEMKRYKTLANIKLIVAYESADQNA
jgi:hypothetical protein